MKIPKQIQPLVDQGMVDEVIRQLMSGKEADVYIVRCGSNIRCAKVYKDANKRSFKKAVNYQEGRKVRNSRRTRAMEKHSKFGKQQQEEIWQNAEVDALHCLSNAGVRVPRPYDCFNGVLVMELITDEQDQVAPRLADVVMTREKALEHHALVMKYVMLMLCAGIIHGDLSEFNVLVDESGPVIIDLPQVVDPTSNNQAQFMLERDVETITNYFSRYAPELINTRYAKEIWDLYENGILDPEKELTGMFEENTQPADVDAVMQEIKEAFAEEQERLARFQEREQYSHWA